MEIANILLERGLINAEQKELAASKANGQRVDQVIVEMGIASEEATLRVLASELHMEFIDLRTFDVNLELVSTFPVNAIYRHCVLPLEETEGLVTMAISDPFDLNALDELSSVTGYHLVPVLACREEILLKIKDSLGVAGDTISELVSQRTDEEVELLEDIPDDLGELAESAQAPSVIRLVNQLLTEAVEQKASDVHIEPEEHGLSVRYRVDGLLRVQPVPPEINSFFTSIVTRLKIMSRLNIAEKRLPQDGRIKLRIHGREVDVRVSIIPMIHGEGVVMRLLDKDRMVFNLANVGLPDDVSSPFRQLISMPHGIVLVTGPTGSGKTTTLYSALNEIKDPATKIITVEDPVEYHMDGISQIQVHHKIGLSFAAGLRSILRHDPDVVLIGEIRDEETARSAIQASLTGHLVFSTLHTNDAPGAYTRLIDMGVEPYLVASTVEGVLAQRLIRKLCPHCKEEFTPVVDELPHDLDTSNLRTLFRPVGCRLCHDSGYAGRTGIFELMVTDPEIHRLCVEEASAGAIRKHAMQCGMESLRGSAWSKAQAGETSLDEVARITRGDIVL